MKDPYFVLGVSKNATDEEINNAYRELARRYQQDTAADGLDEKMKELNEAYDAVILEHRKSAGSSSAGGSGSAPSTFADIRQKLLDGRIDDAETLLDGIPQSMRNAEWNFLKGTVMYRRGWFEEASRYYNIAVNMDPGNREYAAARNNLNSTRNGQYRTSQQPRGSTGCSGCDVCSSLLCADCCCECMGGDLIRCC